MKLENQLSNIELSKELKKLGVKQESLHYWTKKPTRGYCLGKKIKGWNQVSAFTVAELGEMLPKTIKCKAIYGKEKDGHINYHYYEDVNNKPHYQIKYVVYGYEEYSYIVPWINADTEANARTKMLIYLKENN